MISVHGVLAPNPGLFTGPGTNSWLVESQGRVVVVDPGPAIDSHLDAIRRRVVDREVVAVAVTHTHPDHAPAANVLAADWHVPALGFADGPDFAADRHLSDGDRIDFGASQMIAWHTPGHTRDHMCFQVDDVMFSGDHIMGGSTVIMEDLAAYLDSLQLVIDLAPRLIHPGHGPDISDPVTTARDYLAHRYDRESQILAALRSGCNTVGEIVESVYTDVSSDLHPAAAISVGAHLRKLQGEGRVAFDAGEAEWTTAVELTGEAS